MLGLGHVVDLLEDIGEPQRQCGEVTVSFRVVNGLSETVPQRRQGVETTTLLSRADETHFFFDDLAAALDIRLYAAS